MTLREVIERAALIALAVLMMLAVWALSAVQYARAGEGLTGLVERVIDGDTLVVGGLTVRLAGLDCPETDQPYGREATALAARLALGREVRVLPRATGRYGRTIATVTLPGGRDLGLELIKAGLAWARSKAYRAAQAAAKKARAGLWADPNPTPPWRWRRNRRTR